MPYKIKMASIFINDIKVTLPEKTTILQACDEIGIDVPRFVFMSGY